MRKASIFILIAMLIAGGTAWRMQAQVDEEQEGLLARAAISADAAQQTALAAVPNGRIEESEIEEENGRLIYAFDIVLDGETWDVEVDAVTGELLQAEI